MACIQMIRLRIRMRFLIECVTDIDDSLYEIAKGAGSDYGTGGMKTKI